MANRKHVAWLKQGVEAWNQWRRENPKIRPNLSRADLIRASLRGADLRRTDLSKADLSHADLDYAKLRGTGLSKSGLTHSLGWVSGMKRPEAVERQKMDAGGMVR